MSTEDAVDKRDHVTAEALKHLNSASDFKYHKMSQAEVVASMGTNLDRGLSSAEAAARLEKGGRNVLDAEEPETIWEKIKEQFEDLLAQILFGAAIVSFFIAVMGDGEEGLAAYVEPFVILLILALNALVFLVQHQLSRRRVAPAPDVAKSRKTAASRRPEGADRSAEFWLFQTQWLAVYLVIVLADWLQGTHSCERCRQARERFVCQRRHNERGRGRPHRASRMGASDQGAAGKKSCD